MSRFRRAVDDSGHRVYLDERESFARFFAMAHFGIDLHHIDDWIESSDTPSFTNRHLKDVLEWRGKLIEAAGRHDQDAAEGWALFLATLVHLNQREAFLLPLAHIGDEWKHKLPPRGQRAVVYNPVTPARRRKERDVRIEGALRRGVPPPAVAKAEGVSLRTVQRLKASLPPE